MEDEKTLEDIDLPLRHFFLASDDLDGSDLLLPAPAPSIRDRIVQINFEVPLHRTIALSLSVDPGPGCGGIAWPAGEVLATYIAKRGSALDGQNVLELGSGTGLVGLVAGHLGARISSAYHRNLFFFYPADTKKAISFLSWSAISCLTDWNPT